MMSSSAPGLRLFSNISYANYFIILILGTAFFATSITEEKEERTLGLLKMAGVGPAALILGKWLPRLLAAGLLLCVQLPYLMLSITMGGVLWDQIAAVYLSLFAHLFLVGNLGLLCSVVMATTTSACTTAFVLLAGLHFLPFLLFFYLTDTLAFSPDSPFVLACSTAMGLVGFGQLSYALSTSFDGTWLGLQVVGDMLLGGVFLGSAWGLFGVFNKNEQDSASVTLYDRLRRSMARKIQRRPWRAALEWKDYQLSAGGTLALSSKLVLYLIVLVGLPMLFGSFRYNYYRELGGFLFWFSLLGLVLELGVMSARIYRTELTDKTWSTLYLLPYSTREVLYRKLLGGSATVLPAVICAGLGILLMGKDFWRGFNELFRYPEAFLGFTYFVLQILLALHVSVLLSITQKWASWPVAVVLSGFLVMMGNSVVWSCLAFGIGGREEFGVLMTIACLISTGLVLWGHFTIGHQMSARAAE